MTADRTRKKAAPAKKAPAKTATAKKTPAKKAPSKNAPSKNATAKKAPSKKTPAKKAPAEEAPRNELRSGSDDDAEQQPRRRASAPRAQGKPARSAGQVARHAVDQLAQLTGRSAEGVTGLERVDEGWRVTVEVVEVRRVPETTDVLARYEVDTDDHGDLTSYRRSGRYTRGSAREE